MAFGLGFDKTKILQTAEKYVIQGKISDAINEYKKILKKDPKDLMTLNTVGDLYVRSGKSEEALKVFYELAEKSIEAGFVPRAIAVYKRITKIDPNALPALSKLGELYSMQGLMRDARTHYLQAVEIHMRQQDLVKAREVFEKVWLLDMDNPRLQRRMAELYAQTGKPNEAIATFLSSAERFLDANDTAEATATLDELAKLDPDNAEARVLRGRLQLSLGEFDKAIHTLQDTRDLAANKGALNTLFHAHRLRGDVERSKEIASQLFDAHEDFAGLALLAEDRMGRGDSDGALAIYQEAAPKLEAQGAYSALIDGLRKILAINAASVPALELLWQVYRRMGSIGEGRETAEQLAHAYVAAEQLEKAREVAAELVALEPENSEHRRLLRQIETRLGTVREDVVPEATPIMAVDVAAPEDVQASRIDTLPPREQMLVKNCLTESEIYITYHQTQKAIDVLEAGLREVPGNITLCEHLLPLYEQSRLYQKAAECAQALTEAYVKLGDGERATRYGELIVSYEQKAAEFGAAPAPVEAPPEPIAPPPEPQQHVREIDLSSEWETLAQPSAPAVDGILEEIEFYLQAGLKAEAITALDRLRQQAPGHASIADFERRLGLEAQPTSGVVETVFSDAAAAPKAADVAADSAASNLSTAPIGAVFDAQVANPAIPEPLAASPAQPAAPLAAADIFSKSSADAVAQPELTTPLGVPPSAPLPEFSPPAPQPLFAEASSLAEGAITSPAAATAESAIAAEIAAAATASPGEAASSAPATAPAAAEEEHALLLDDVIAAKPFSMPAAAPASFELALDDVADAGAPAVAAQNNLAALAGELEKGWEAPASPAQSGAAAQGAAAQPASAAPAADFSSGFLDDVFAEFKEEVGESAGAGNGEDLETHYNMGVAFKEMALYDEAIGEFQKVHQLAQQAKDYSHLVQCCSLLATCFLEKGMPQLAVTWYQTALNSPGADPESAMALLYEMGSAYELAGDRENALKSYLDVYARNIDYRNVAERIRELQQSS